MKLLLDTHVFLWYITGEPRLAPSWREAIRNAEVAYLSVVSIWETLIKFQLGKLPLPEPPNPWLMLQREKHGIAPLPLTEEAVSRLQGLPAHHRDPFDRVLVCQAIEHHLQIVTVDPLIIQYQVSTLPAA